MYVVLLNYIQPLSVVDLFVDEHRRFLERGYASGHFLLSGRKQPRTGGVLLVAAQSRIEVENIVKDDPFHRERIAEYEIIEFVPSMAAEQFSNWVS